MIIKFFKKIVTFGIIILFFIGSISSGALINLNDLVHQSYSGNTLYVGGSGPGNYTSIQDAIDDASDGDTIKVYEGTYAETVVVNKRVDLIGNGPTETIIDGGFPEHEHVIFITANGANVSGFGVKNSYMGHEYGGIGVQSTNNRIFNNYCWNNLYGIILFGGQNKIYNNSIFNNKRDGIFIKSSGNIINNNICYNSSERDGIWLYISNNNIISNNTCSYNSKNGITLYQSNNNHIFNNICNESGLYSGIFVYESSNNEINNNKLSSNYDEGIGISYFSDNNILTNNILIDNKIGLNIYGNCCYNIIKYNSIMSNDEQGIYVDSSSNNTIAHNNITNNNGGILLEGAQYNQIYENNIKNNGLNGIHIMPSSYDSDNNKIYHNNFIGNIENAHDECTNIWDNDYPSGGNYWHDYKGIDADGDGIGDTPYPIPGDGNEDRYPLMNPWSDNLNPVAEFTWIPENPEPLETILFNASDSYDPDGYIILYEWDWNDDGEFDENHTTHTATYSWANDGEYTVTLRVTDNGIHSSIKTKTVKVGNQPPDAPQITGQIQGKVGVEYEYSFSLFDSDNDTMYLRVDWGNGTPGPWDGPYDSGTVVKLKHTWNQKGTFTIRAQAKDIYDAESEWGTLVVTMPKDKMATGSLLFLLLEYLSQSFHFISFLFGF